MNMENKINIAELLKDCPKGMELDCTIFDGTVILESIDIENDFSINIRLSNGNLECLTKTGGVIDEDLAKCVIFPKGKTTWEGFVPPCKFKDGDIITYSFGTCIFRGEGEIEGTVDYYCGISSVCNHFSVKDNKCRPDGHYGLIVNYRLATEEEKQKLFDAIKENGYKWNPETKTLEKLIEPKFKVGDKIRFKENHNYVYTITAIREEENKYECGITFILRFTKQDDWELVPNKFDITTLKPFDKVLVRDNNEQKWTVDLFSFYDKDLVYKYVCVGHYVDQCIPYKGNEHLLGKRDDCDDFYKTWGTIK